MCGIIRIKVVKVKFKLRELESLNGLGRKGLKNYAIPPPAMGRDTSHQTRLPKAPSHLALNTSREGTSTSSLNNILNAFRAIRKKPALLKHTLEYLILSQKNKNMCYCVIFSRGILSSHSRQNNSANSSYFIILKICLFIAFLKK